MHVRTLALLSTFAAASMLLQGCGSSGSSTIVPGPVPTGNPAPGPDPSGFIADSIGAMNAVGSMISNNQDYDGQIGIPLGGPQSAHRQTSNVRPNVACVGGVQFFAPAKYGAQAGNALSTERITYYDPIELNGHCTQIAVDEVRVAAAPPSGSAESLGITTSKYAVGAWTLPATPGTPTAVRTETVNYSGGTYDQYFFPHMAAGLARIATRQLAVAGVNTTNQNDEFIATGVAAPVLSYCADWAGFNQAGNGTATYGWTGQTDPSNATRTNNSDGSESFALTLIGTPYTGGIGAMSIAPGTPNASCPVTTAAFSLTGGTAKTGYTMPMVLTLKSGNIVSLTVGGAGGATPVAFSNGESLTAQSNSGVGPANPAFITGTLNGSNGAIGNFATDAFGAGTLTVTGYGTAQPFRIVDWHVLQH